MVANRAKVSETPIPERPPATTPEGREAQCIAYAYDLVEQRLRNGTASSQETVHFLKLGSMRERLEVEKLKKENALLKVKADAISADAEKAQMYKDAIAAMQRYSAWTSDGI